MAPVRGTFVSYPRIVNRNLVQVQVNEVTEVQVNEVQVNQVRVNEIQVDEVQIQLDPAPSSEVV